MKRAILLVALVSMQTFSSAAAPARAYHGALDGATLLHNYVGPPRPDSDPFLKGGDSLNHELARGYLDGIKDVTEGSVWCYRGAGKPHELSEDITGVLAKMSADELKGPAAPLVVKALRQLYPCPSSPRRTS